MALVSALAVGCGGALGAVSRFAVAEAIERRVVDTALVNVVGSLLFGIVLGLDAGGPTSLAATTGFCGAFTTFSSFAVETVRLAEKGHVASAITNAGGTLLVAFAAVLIGIVIGSAAAP